MHVHGHLQSHASLGTGKLGFSLGFKEAHEETNDAKRIYPEREMREENGLFLEEILG